LGGMTLLVTIAFVGLGAYFLVVYRRWHAYTTALAVAHPIAEARRRAVRAFPLVVAAIAVPGLVVIAWALQRVAHLLVLILFVASLAPALLWWRRHWPSLEERYGQK